MFCLACLAVAGCSKDPEVRKKELRTEIAGVERIIANYKENKLDGVDELETWKADLESELKDLESP
jgi:hypothetical protein